MTGLALTARERRLLAVGAAVVVPALAWKLVAEPYRDSVRAAQVALDGRRRLLARELQLVRDAAGARALRDTARARLAGLAGRVLDGGDAAAADAALAEAVRAIADDSRVLLTQVEGTPPAAGAGGLVSHGLRLDGEGDVEGLLTFLAAVETDSLLMRVERLEVAARRTGAPVALPRTTVALPDASGAEEAETLTFRAVIRAFALRGVPQQPAASADGGTDGVAEEGA